MGGMLLPLAETAFLVGGCAVIHAFRRHADVITTGLAPVAVLLGLMVCAASVPPEALNRYAATLSEQPELVIGLN